MALAAVRHDFTGLTTPYTAYDSSKTNLGKLIQQRTGGTPLDKFAGPMPLGFTRVGEGTTIAAQYPHVIPFTADIDWVFLADGAAAAATRRILHYEFQKSTSTFTYKGFITLTPPTTGNQTIRGFRAIVENYSTGTVAVSGTAVTGTGSAWLASRLSVGCRIGFGSTDPTQISTWFEISAIGSDTGITLTATAGTISAGTSYVIQDMMMAIVTTNATPANGGLFVAKGIRPEIFTGGGTTIAAATTVDNLRLTYWLGDASTSLNTVACGLAREDITSWTSQNLYVLDGTASVIVYKYNLRAALTLTAGKDPGNSLVLKTGAQAVTGTNSQTNNGRVATLGHGPGSGVPSLYFVTTTRIYRAAISGITAASTTWQSDFMTENPPGSSTTYALTAALAAIEQAASIDRLVVMSTGATGFRSYVTQYRTDAGQMDHIFLLDTKQTDTITVDSGTVPHPSTSSTFPSLWVEGGVMYYTRLTSTVAINHMYAIPIGAHWQFAGLAGANQNRLITPKLTLTGAVKLDRLYVNNAEMLGTANLGSPTEPYRAYYRTSGIDDDSGGWTLLDDTRDLSGASASGFIQFMFEFRVLGEKCIPTRIHGLVVTYENDSTDSRYEPSVGKSNLASRIVAYRQKALWGGTIPNLRIRLFNATSGALLLDDTVVASALGVWERSPDGTTWSAWSSGADLVGNYIRYTATSLPGVAVRALLTQ